MTSTHRINLDRVVQNLKDDPDICQENTEIVLNFVNAMAAEGIGKSQQRKYIHGLKRVLKKFAPDGFSLAIDEATEEELREVMAGVHRSDYAGGTKQIIAVSLKKCFKWQNDEDGYPDMVGFINTTRKKTGTVKREDLFTEQERQHLFNQFNNLRDRAFAITLYESAARPGELMGCNIADVQFNEKGDFIDLEGAKGTPDRTNQLIEAGQLLRQWIKAHPAGGDIHDPKDPRAPLWVKTQQNSCQKCGKTPQTHDTDGCENYAPVDWERMDYHAWYRRFKRACEKAETGDHRPYDFRHTRITEVSQFMSHEQLCKFAGWRPGSDRAKVYVHLTSDDVNRAIREEYGLRTGNEESEKVTCKFCGTRNDGGDFDCRNCKRPLSLEKAEQQEDLQKAVEVYNRLEDAGGLETLEKLETLMANAEKIEDLVGA